MSPWRVRGRAVPQDTGVVGIFLHSGLIVLRVHAANQSHHCITKQVYNATENVHISKSTSKRCKDKRWGYFG
jgi:tartrate dehydratase alpha subunit/fumarate hydratase class I-like protein